MGLLAAGAGSPHAALAYLIEADQIYNRLDGIKAAPRDVPAVTSEIEKLKAAVAPHSLDAVARSSDTYRSVYEASIGELPDERPGRTLSAECWEASLAAVSEFDAVRGLTIRNARE
jgi:hypothetical protein